MEPQSGWGPDSKARVVSSQQAQERPLQAKLTSTRLLSRSPTTMKVESDSGKDLENQTLCVRKAGSTRESWALKGVSTLALERPAWPRDQFLPSPVLSSLSSLEQQCLHPPPGRLDAPWIRPGPSHEEADGPALGPALLSGYPPASLRSSVPEDAVDVGAQAAGGALFQHVAAALLPANRLLVQPRAERDARHLGVRALQVGSWQRWERQEGGVSEHAQPWEPGRPVGGFGPLN